MLHVAPLFRLPADFRPVCKLVVNLDLALDFLRAGGVAGGGAGGVAGGLQSLLFPLPTPLVDPLLLDFSDELLESECVGRTDGELAGDTPQLWALFSRSPAPLELISDVVG